MDEYFNCPHCKKDIKKEDKESHNEYCLYVPKTEEFEDLIPCEFCDDFVKFSDYEQHVSQCGISRLRPSLNFNQFNNNLYPLQNSQENMATTLNTLNDLFSTISSNITIQPVNNSMRNIINSNINNEITTLLNNASIEEEGLNDNDNNDNNDNDDNDDNDDELELPEINNFTQNININSNDNEINYSYNENQSLASNLSQYFSNYNINFINNNDDIYTNTLLSTINSAISDTIVNNLNEDEYSSLINLSEEIGDVEIGINDLDKVTEIVNITDTCPICKDEHNVMRKTICNHLFCQECIETWFEKNTKCPLCLKDLNEIND